MSEREIHRWRTSESPAEIRVLLRAERKGPSIVDSPRAKSLDVAMLKRIRPEGIVTPRRLNTWWSHGLLVEQTSRPVDDLLVAPADPRAQCRRTVGNGRSVDGELYNPRSCASRQQSGKDTASGVVEPPRDSLVRGEPPWERAPFLATW